MGVGPFYTTKLYGTKQELLNALMTRNGIPPPWASKGKVQVVAPQVHDAEDAIGDPLANAKL
jgi:hypothetical protein